MTEELGVWDDKKLKDLTLDNEEILREIRKAIEGERILGYTFVAVTTPDSNGNVTRIWTHEDAARKYANKNDLSDIDKTNALLTSRAIALSNLGDHAIMEARVSAHLAGVELPNEVFEEVRRLVIDIVATPPFHDLQK